MRNLHKMFFVFVSLFFFINCSDDNNPVKDSDTDHDHTEAVGCLVSSNGVELARYEKGEVTGTLTVKAGEETALLTIRFIAEDGDIFQPQDENYSLDWEFASDIVQIEQREEKGRWEFHLVGINVGATEVTFKVLHGDHADFVAKPIPIHVTD